MLVEEINITILNRLARKELLLVGEDLLSAEHVSQVTVAASRSIHFFDVLIPLAISFPT